MLVLRRSLESQYWVKLIAGSIILYGLYWYNSPYQRCDNLGKKLEASNIGALDKQTIKLLCLSQTFW